MRCIEKRVSTKYFDAIENKEKNFEVWKDEDDIQVGDIVGLYEYDENDGKYTGRFTFRDAKYVMRETKDYGLQEGYYIVGF